MAKEVYLESDESLDPICSVQTIDAIDPKCPVLLALNDSFLLKKVLKVLQMFYYLILKYLKVVFSSSLAVVVIIKLNVWDIFAKW